MFEASKTRARFGTPSTAHWIRNCSTSGRDFCLEGPRDLDWRPLRLDTRTCRLRGPTPGLGLVDWVGHQPLPPLKPPCCTNCRASAPSTPEALQSSDAALLGGGTSAHCWSQLPPALSGAHALAANEKMYQRVAAVQRAAAGEVVPVLVRRLVSCHSG